MTCPHCEASNERGALFCRQCGERLASTCARCGAAVDADDRFCAACGLRLGGERSRSEPDRARRDLPRNLTQQLSADVVRLEGEQKRVTVLFCDIANSMTLAEDLGPERMHALLNDFFAIALTEVRAYQGTINQFLGDGIMALFGAPIAHEEHERLAMLAALGIERGIAHQALGQLLLRMGIHTGPVVVGRIGDSERMDYTAVGDTTNLAARLQQAAEPGAILVSGAVASRGGDSFVLEAMPGLIIKGRRDPVEAYRLTSRRRGRGGGTERGRRAASPFVGRDHELGVLQQAAAAVRRGDGRVVAVEGDAGLGKSRLVDEARRLLLTSEMTVLEGQCVSYGSLIPYLPVVDMLRDLCGVGEGDSSGAVADHLRDALARAEVDTEAHAPYLLRLLGIADERRALEVLRPETVKAHTFDLLRRLLTRASERAPLLVVFENLHWIDKMSEEFIGFLVDAIPRARIMLLVTYRPDYRPHWLEKAYVTLVIPPLPPAQALTIVRAIPLAEPLADDAMYAIVARAEGNPFFLEELTRAVAEHRDQRIALELPDTVQEVLMARIDRLPATAKRLLQVASVLGRTASLRLLTELWDDRQIEGPLRDVERGELLYERVDGDEVVYVFKHALIQDVAYASLLTVRREVLHAKAADVLERLYADRLDQVYDRLAFHYSRTRATDKAIEYLLRLADRAAHWYAHAEAVGTLEEALAHVERLPEGQRDRTRVEIALRQAASLHFLGRFVYILALLLPLRDIVDRLDDAALAGEFHVRLGRTYDVLGEHARAVESANLALAAAARCGDHTIAGKAEFVLAYVGYWSGRHREGVAHARRAVELLGKGDAHWWRGQAHWVAGVNHIVLGEFSDALASLRHAGAIADEIVDRRLQSSVAWTTGVIHALGGDWDGALAACRRAVELAPDPLGRAVAEGVLGGVYVEKSEPARAVPLLEESVRQLEYFRLRQSQGWFMALLAEARLRCGDVERARGLAEAALELTVAVNYGFGEGCARRVLGRIAESTGAHAAAEEHHRAALARFTAIDARYERARTHLDLAQLAIAQGRPDRARFELEEVQRLAAGLPFNRYADQVAKLTAAAGPSPS